MPSREISAALEAAFARRYPRDTDRHRTLRGCLFAVCLEHIARGFADGNAVQRLCSADDMVFRQQLSEILVAVQLERSGLVLHHDGEGPDFRTEHEGRRVWIEVICPEPIGIPAAWFVREDFKVQTLPHEAILLRWTSAIKEKAQKLLGDPARPGSGYLAKGIVAREDAYVIAVNGRLLRGDFPQLEGISQFPFAVEATFGLGPYQITIDRGTLEITGQGHQRRLLIPKPNGAQVPADTFLDARFRPIAAIWAMDVDEALLLDHLQPTAVVHNPEAVVSMPIGALPALSEYVATNLGDQYRLDRLSGALV